MTKVNIFACGKFGIYSRKPQNYELQHILSIVYYIFGKLLRRNNNKKIEMLKKLLGLLLLLIYN